ncbi:MAG: VanZ family protein [Clostridium sp.]|nr:VanZ family protein [Clostridium sp.]
MKIKKIYTAAAVILLIALYIVIFCFSAEDGETSSLASSAVTEALLKGYYGITGGSREKLAETVVLLEGYVRKAAHFTEYMGVGLLSYSIVVLWYGTARKGKLLVAGQVFLSAGLDEFHQYFIPGRSAAFKDVLIDTAGGIMGILIVLLIVLLTKKPPAECKTSAGSR